MRRYADKIWFVAAAATCNLMVWGMFVLLNVPRIDTSALSDTRVTPTVRATFVATTGIPVRIVIPDIMLDVPVQTGTFDPATQEWTLSETSAYYASFSVPVNDSNGTTLIYGHAIPTMFEPLRGIKSGSVMDVYTDNGKIFTYTYDSMREVVPTDTSVLTDVGPPLLVLQTCTGPWDAYRALFQFQLRQVRSV